MPLSEDEQRILQDIERSFYESDPDFAKAVTQASLGGHSSRNAKLAGAGFIVSLVLLLVTFATTPVLGFVGFAGMVTCATIFVRNIRRLVKRANSSVNRRQRIEDFKERLRDRFDQE